LLRVADDIRIGKDTDNNIIVINYRYTEPELEYIFDNSDSAAIIVEGVDKPTLFGEIVQAITGMDGVLVGIRANVVNNSRARVVADVQIKDLEHLYRIIARLNTISGVIEITRG